MRPSDDKAATRHMTRRLLTVPEAAEALDLTVEAVRSRIKRGTLEKEKAPDGSVFVVVETGQNAQSHPGCDQAHDQASAQALINTRLENEVEYLRQQFDHMRTELSRRAEEHAEEIRRRDHLLAAALERIPAIEPPPDTSSERREGHEMVSEERGEGDVPPEREEPISWWRRLFGA